MLKQDLTFQILKIYRQIMKEFVELRAKIYSYLKDNNDEGKKAKAKKSVAQKENLNWKL